MWYVRQERRYDMYDRWGGSEGGKKRELGGNDGPVCTVQYKARVGRHEH